MDEAQAWSDTWTHAGARLAGWLRDVPTKPAEFEDSMSLAPSNVNRLLGTSEASQPRHVQPADQLAHYELQVEARKRVLTPSAMLPPHVEGVFRGTVLEVFDGYFSAQVTNGDPTTPGLIAEFELDDLPEDDRRALQPGSLFHVTVARDRATPRRPRRLTAIRLQRIRRWPQQDLEAARKNAASILSLLADDDGQLSS